MAIDHDPHCYAHNAPDAPCDCEAGRLAMICEGMTAHEAEIGQSWRMLEGFGFPPEACGWPFRDIAGLLPEAIKCALDCLVRQRDEFEGAVKTLRQSQQ